MKKLDFSEVNTYLISLKNITLEEAYEYYNLGYAMEFYYGGYPYVEIRKGI